MIDEVRINNFLAFSDAVELSLEADMRSKRFAESIYESPYIGLNKCACIYGPNNMGKTCIASAISCIVSVMLGEGFPHGLGRIKNLFNESDEVELGMTFCYHNETYAFDFAFQDMFDRSNFGHFTYEKLERQELDAYGRVHKKLIYERSADKCKFVDNKPVEKAMSVLDNTNIVLYLLSTELSPDIKKYRDLLHNFANTVYVVNAPETPPHLTIGELKLGDAGHGKDIVDLIVKLDTDITNLVYDDTRDNPVLDKVRSLDPISGQSRRTRDDLYRLFSTHNGKEFETMLYDSKGTKMIIALAGFIIDALYNDWTLVIDEIDSGLHSSIIRTIISMFSNETNHAAQLILMTQDSSLLDTRSLFRRDQIWFIDRDRPEDESDIRPVRRYLYCLNEFTADEDHVRADSNIEQLYRQGYFGAIPETDVFDVMEHIEEVRAHE